MEGLAKLGINLPALIAQIVNFGILLGLLYLVAYRPIMRMLDERSRRVKEGMEQAEAMKAKAAAIDEEIKKQLEVASRMGQEKIDRAMHIAEEAKQRLQEESKQEAEALLNRARVGIQQERDEAIGELRREFAELTVLAAEKVIERSLDKESHQQLIKKVLEEGLTLKKK